VVVVGGLVSSTALTLVLLPLMFARFGLPRKEREAEAAAQSTENV
jgi:Cu/Ag efflux pump CusA